jgi:uncharacterized protein (DUF983 family)
VSYLHCPNCERTAWFDLTVEPPHECRECGAELAPMPPRRAASLTMAMRARFQREMSEDAGRVRFVRG